MSTVIFFLFSSLALLILHVYLTSRYFENESNEIFTHLSEKGSNCKIAAAMEKERAARKNEEEERRRIDEKAMSHS